MARARKFVSYRNLERPYTRVSKFKSQSFIRMTPNPKVVKFTTGNSRKQFEYVVTLNAKSNLNIRDNALESARQTSNRMLEKELGVASYRMDVKAYPHHVLRENPVASGAGADRFSTGMKFSFGKPIGVAARIMKGQTILQVSVSERNVPLARKALNRAATKLPCGCLVEVEKAPVLATA